MPSYPERHEERCEPRCEPRFMEHQTVTAPPGSVSVMFVDRCRDDCQKGDQNDEHSRLSVHFSRADQSSNLATTVIFFAKKEQVVNILVSLVISATDAGGGAITLVLAWVDPVLGPQTLPWGPFGQSATSTYYQGTINVLAQGTYVTLTSSGGSFLLGGKADYLAAVL
jgi:hypothetical protein